MVKIGYCRSCPFLKMIATYPHAKKGKKRGKGHCKHPNIEKETGKKNVSIYRLINCPKFHYVNLKDSWK